MDYAKVMFRDLPVFDQKAYTTQEIADIYGYKLSGVGRICREHVDAGEWEVVKKKDAKGRAVKAYRPKRK